MKIVNSINNKSNLTQLSHPSNSNNISSISFKKLLFNPLYEVNTAGNETVKKGLKTGNWSEHHVFQSKQHPAWYSTSDGSPVKNKVYWGNLIESRMEELKQAESENDEAAIKQWSEALDYAITNFKKAPGEVPYIVGLNSNDDLAAKYGVERPSEEWFNSKWNNPLVASQGKFEDNMWYENTYFAENPDAAQRAAQAATTSGNPQLAKAAQEINKGMTAYFASLQQTQEQEETKKVAVQSKSEKSAKETEEKTKQPEVSFVDLIGKKFTQNQLTYQYRAIAELYDRA